MGHYWRDLDPEGATKHDREMAKVIAKHKKKGKKIKKSPR